MRSPKTIRLPRPKELRSNKVEDIQNFIERFFTELDSVYRKLHQDLSTIQIDDDGWVYFGNKDTNGSWRIGRSGDDMKMQLLVTGTWTDTGFTYKGS